MKDRLDEAYILLLSSTPALINRRDRSPNPEALRLNQMLLDRVEKWVDDYERDKPEPSDES